MSVKQHIECLIYAEICSLQGLIHNSLWPQTVYGQILLLPRIIQWLDSETNVLLWHCQTQQGDLQVWTRVDLTAILWREKRNVCILTNIHDAPAEGNFCDNNGKAIKPQIVADYTPDMSCVDKGDGMANSSLSTVAHGSVQRNCSCICLNWLFWTTTFFFPRGVRKFHIGIFS